jgi:Post-segregation antitoxin CcdA
MPSDANAMAQKGNVVLYLDKELVTKSKELGLNLSKTFENHLKHLITQFSTCNSLNNFNSTIKNAEKWAEPDSDRRPLARKANVLTRLDDRPPNISLVSKLVLFTLRFWSRINGKFTSHGVGNTAVKMNRLKTRC